MTHFGLPLSDRVLRLRQVAHNLHRKQTDIAGRPYVEHLDAVLLGVIVLGGSEAEQVAALFHDSVEDGWITLDDLEVVCGLTGEEVEIVAALTKWPGEHWRANLQRVMRCGPKAAGVKVADLLNNTRHDRVAVLMANPKTAPKVEERMDRYQQSLTTLLEFLGLLPHRGPPKIFF